jgi:hypothetical protein
MTEHVNDQNYINYIHVYKVANGHIIQIKCVGMSVETTFIVSKEDDLGSEIQKAITKVLGEKV